MSLAPHRQISHWWEDVFHTSKSSRVRCWVSHRFPSGSFPISCSLGAFTLNSQHLDFLRGQPSFFFSKDNCSLWGKTIVRIEYGSFFSSFHPLLLLTSTQTLLASSGTPLCTVALRVLPSRHGIYFSTPGTRGWHGSCFSQDDISKSGCEERLEKYLLTGFCSLSLLFRSLWAQPGNWVHTFLLDGEQHVD